jgi:hypothetical protein
MEKQHGRQVLPLWNYFTRFIGLLDILSIVFVGPAKIARNAAGQCVGSQGDKRTDCTPERIYCDDFLPGDIRYSFGD